VHRPLKELSPAILWVLRLGLYQAEHLDRIPVHAMVHSSVELARDFGNPGAAGLVNAVLRKAPDRLATAREPDASEDPVGHLEARASHPAWMLRRWLEAFGFRKTMAIAAAGNRKPSLTLRVASKRVDPQEIERQLAEAGIPAERGEFLPEAIRLPGGWHPIVEDITGAGHAVVQDESAGLVAHVARPEPGLRILDVCAAPGGKGTHLASLCGDSPMVAADISPGRARFVEASVAALGLRNTRVIVADGTRPVTDGGFDRVLVDAPCSNTGVLGRRSDARWRRGPDAIVRLVELQGRLLEASRSQVGPGGILVYSTCSLEPEENDGVVASYLDRHPEDRLLPAGEVLPEEVVDGDFYRTDPSRLPLDGAFAAAILPGGKA
jgi:16S rRNA (cytosine967-C5)-methyltransferase